MSLRATKDGARTKSGGPELGSFGSDTICLQEVRGSSHIFSSDLGEGGVEGFPSPSFMGTKDVLGIDGNPSTYLGLGGEMVGWVVEPESICASSRSRELSGDDMVGVKGLHVY